MLTVCLTFVRRNGPSKRNLIGTKTMTISPHSARRFLATFVYYSDQSTGQSINQSINPPVNAQSLI